MPRESGLPRISGLPRASGAPRLSRGASLLPALRRSLFDLQDDPTTARPTLSILPPLPIARSASWTSFALVGLLGLVATFLVVSWSGAVQRMFRGDIGSHAAASGPELEELPWFPVLKRTARAAEEADSPNVDDPSRADAKLTRSGRSTLSHGVFFLPPTFASADGEYDLVLFFHGNTDLVEDGMILSGINAAVVVFNFGNGSGAYYDPMQGPARFHDILVRAQDEMSSRGLSNAKLRRTALVSWSAGYGAVQAIISNPKYADVVDSIVMLDGMHAKYIGDGPQIHPASLGAFTRFAERAIEGEKLFVLTHSNIEPMGYASVARSADMLLSLVNVERKKVSGETFIPAYVSLKGVLPADQIVALQPRTEARSGSLIIKGYGGNQANHHVSHLIQFPDIALGHLVERWTK